jgi:hypothetical protein
MDYLLEFFVTFGFLVIAFLLIICVIFYYEDRRHDKEMRKYDKHMK